MFGIGTLRGPFILPLWAPKLLLADFCAPEQRTKRAEHRGNYGNFFHLEGEFTKNRHGFPACVEFCGAIGGITVAGAKRWHSAEFYGVERLSAVLCSC